MPSARREEGTALDVPFAPTPEDDNRVRGTAHKLARELGLQHAVDDLIGYGYQGLVEAQRSFDASRGIPFGPFTYYRIRGAILDGAKRVAGLSRRAYARILALTNEMLEDEAYVQARAPQSPTLEEATHTLDDLLGNAMAAMVLAPAAEESPTPESQLDEQLHRRRVRRAIEQLPERERQVVVALYFDERRLIDVGGDLGISTAGAWRLHARALDSLRASLRTPSG